jgi:hypothetical protein
MPNWDLTRGDVVRVRRLPPGFENLAADQQQIYDLCLGRVFEVRGLDDHGRVEIDVTRIGEREMFGRFKKVFIDSECLEVLDR